MFHLRDLASGRRRLIRSKDIKSLGVPQYEGLSTNNILEWAANYPEVSEALPTEPREIDKLLRQYVINVIYTLVGEPFRQWVETVMTARDARITEERQLGIELDPEILRVFRNSSAVSSKFWIFFCSPICVQLRRAVRPTWWNRQLKDAVQKRRLKKTGSERRSKSKRFRPNYSPGPTWRPN